MEIKTFRGGTMQEALDMVRRELGPDAVVLHTREVRKSGLLRWTRRSTHIEVSASDGVNVPSRLPARMLQQETPPAATAEPPTAQAASLSAADTAVARSSSWKQDYRERYRNHATGQLGDLHSMVEQLCQSERTPANRELPSSLFDVYTDLIEADVSEDMARELVECVRQGASAIELADPLLVKRRMAELIEDKVEVTGPIQTHPGRRRLVALVGPTGVGKTTTIAKLAAHYRLREKLRVGLITVDTYRIAAVEQLRTYADIIDLPMEVVATPREMREAIQRVEGLDLVLMDTAGRSPRDEVRIQELKSMLAEAGVDEVHLVLSSISGAQNLASTAQRFAEVGTTALIMTKLDEASGLGNILPLLDRSRLPVSYLTNGQNVPDDIIVADKQQVAATILGTQRQAV